MIRAASMVYALFIVTILTMICAAFIFGFLYHNSYEQSIAARTKQISYLESGVQLLKSDYRQEEYYSEKKLLFDNDSGSMVRLIKKPWGVFELIQCISQTNNQSLQKSYLLGDNIDHYRDLSLYLTDNGQPLSISGKTHLEGLFYLPEAGVKRAYIEGKSYRGIELIYGETSTSQKKKIELTEEILKHIKHSKNRSSVAESDSLLNASYLFESDSISRSFTQPTLFIDSRGPLTIKNITVTGNVVIHCDSTVKIEKTARLSNILIFAKNIFFEEQFSGFLQAFATDSILIQADVTLHYPSVIATVNKKNSGTQLIQVDEGSAIHGIILQERDRISTNDVSLINLKKESRLVGQLYTMGKVNLGGSVWGSVICDKFTLSTTSSIYENHLLDAEINSKKLSPDYAGINLIEKFKKREKSILREVE